MDPLIAALARAAGLDKALAAFPDDVAAADIERDVIEQFAVFAFDHGGAFDNFYVGDRTKRDEHFAAI